MKIAIPTDDGLKISPDFKKAKGFLILKVRLNEIVDGQVKWVPNGKPELSQSAIITLLDGCSALIVKLIDEVYCRELKENSIECIITAEDIITNIMVHFLEHEYRQASNTCCCP